MQPGLSFPCSILSRMSRQLRSFSQISPWFCPRPESACSISFSHLRASCVLGPASILWPAALWLQDWGPERGRGEKRIGIWIWRKGQFAAWRSKPRGGSQVPLPGSTQAAASLLSGAGQGHLDKNHNTRVSWPKLRACPDVLSCYLSPPVTS